MHGYRLAPESYEVQRLYIYCDGKYTVGSEYILFKPKTNMSVERIFLYEQFCRGCGKQIFDSKTPDMLLTLKTIGGWKAVRYYLEIIVEQ